MTSNTDKSATSVSLDTVFTPPTRQQWIEMAVAGQSDSQSDMDALHKLRRTTLEGIPLEVLYDSASHTVDLGVDSGVLEWDNRVCVSLSEGTLPSRANACVLQGLQGGATSIELHVNDATQIPACLAGAQLDLAPISFRSNNDYAQCRDTLVAYATDQGHEPHTMRCAFNADPIGIALASRLSPDTTVKSISNEVATMATFAKDNAQKLPQCTSVLVDTAVHHNAGASTVEEIHAALATATLYLEAMLEAGISMKDACDQIVFQVAMDADILLGVAKLRAIRALWQRVSSSMNDTATPAHPANIVAETSQRFGSLLEPWNNHLRNLAASTAAALGGANTLLVHPHDVLQRDNASFDTELGDRMARNIAIILERECSLLTVRDPMAGSYAIENLTRQLMQYAWESLASTDTGEGWLDELFSGRWQTRLTHTHRQRVTLMDQEQRIAVGVNRFIQTDEATFTAAANTSHAASSMLTAVRDATTFEPGTHQESKP